MAVCEDFGHSWAAWLLNFLKSTYYLADQGRDSLIFVWCFHGISQLPFPQSANHTMFQQTFLASAVKISPGRLNSTRWPFGPSCA